MMSRDADEIAFDLFYAEAGADGIEIARPINAQTGGGVLAVGRVCKSSAELEQQAEAMLAHPINVEFIEEFEA
jgi:hypothetical protein